MTICDRIDEVITDGDILVQDIAEYCGVSRQQVARWRKSNEPTARNLKMICTLYKVSADYILGLPDNLNWPRRPTATKRN